MDEKYPALVLSRLSVSQQPHIMDSFSHILLYIWCCQLPHLYEKNSSVMHDAILESSYMAMVCLEIVLVAQLAALKSTPTRR